LLQRLKAISASWRFCLIVHRFAVPPKKMGHAYIRVVESFEDLISRKMDS
jgi:hypothetical protein